MWTLICGQGIPTKSIILRHYESTKLAVCLYITIRYAVKFLLLFHYFHARYCLSPYIQMPNCDEIHRFSLVQSYRTSHLLQYQYYTEIAPQYMYKLNLTMMFSVHLFSSLQVIIQFWAKLHYIHVCDV